MMSQKHFIEDMYKAIDAGSSVGMCNYLTEDAAFRFANMPAVVGKSNIITFLDGFFQSIKAIRHTELEYWNSGKVWFVTGNVNYTRHDDSILRVPFGVLLKMKGDLVQEFMIFVDNSELYK